ncbi:MAG: S26 family signal peptidase [Aquabacterium sp.]|nr:S26 family signal peptidase [Aquabacterium sp.]MDI1260277.1 S26 family signal peptidase [Aquabacterium sp.]
MAPPWPRDNCADSRYFGFVPRHLLVGRAHPTCWSLPTSRAGGVPAWSRAYFDGHAIA